MLNRRSKARHVVLQRVDVKFYRVGGMPDLEGLVMSALLGDVSDCGVGVRLERAIPVDTRIDLRVSLADPPSSFSHRGVVRWTAPDENEGHHRVGIEFVGGSATHMEEWRRAVQQMGSAVPG